MLDHIYFKVKGNEVNYVRIGVWSELRAHPTKIKTTEISSEGSGGISMKICTNENFPGGCAPNWLLYGIDIMDYVHVHGIGS